MISIDSWKCGGCGRWYNNIIPWCECNVAKISTDCSVAVGSNIKVKKLTVVENPFDQFNKDEKNNNN